MGKIAISSLIEKVPRHTEEVVDTTIKRLNQRVRDLLRRKTGFSFVPKEIGPDRVQVSVSSKAGLPKQLEGLQVQEGAWVLPHLLDLRRELKAFVEAGPKLFDRLLLAEAEDERARTYLKGRLSGFSPTLRLMQDLMHLLTAEDPIPKVLAVDSDILGIYQYRVNDFRRADVFLYWGVIGIVAGGLGVGVDALAAVVLVHELAHAYTHLGFDIDDRQWPGDRFHEAEHPLKEGLAQYYTHLVVDELEIHLPGVRSAYEKLLVKQPEAYRTHMRWLQLSKDRGLFDELLCIHPIGRSTPEEVRIALLEARRSTIHASVARFEEVLLAAKLGLDGAG